MGGQVTLLRHGEIMDGKEALPLLQKGALFSSFWFSPACCFLAISAH